MTSESRRYEILQKIGEGGMAEIYHAKLHHPNGLTQTVVIKRLMPRLARDPKNVNRFADEARVSLQLRHPNVVESFDAGEDHENYFITMEHVDGPSLGQIFAHCNTTGRRLPLPLALHIGARVADGLHYAHELTDFATGRPLQIVHRDVSPDNILVSRYGDVKLTDFGIAHVEHKISESVPGTITGKVGYLSPEQIQESPVDRRTDIFQLGIVLWELLTGRYLYGQLPATGVWKSVLEEPATPPSSIVEGIPERIDALVLSALEKDPERRQQTAAEIGTELDAWLHEHHWRDAKSILVAWMNRSGLGGADALLEEDTVQNREVASFLDETMRATPRKLTPDPWLEATQVTSTSDSLELELKTNVIRERSPFYGREADLDNLRHLLKFGSRLISVVAPAGMGKTRLLQQFAEDSLEHYADEGGVWICDFSGVRSVEDACHTFGRTLGVDVVPSTAEQSLVDGVARALAGRGRTLVVLDAFELPEIAQETLARWLDLVGQVRFVVTARRRLQIPGEVVYELGPLVIPDDRIGLPTAGALELFLNRVAKHRGTDAISEHDRANALEIVRRLEGTPLAIEIVAAEARVLSLEAIANGLGQASENEPTHGGPGDPNRVLHRVILDALAALSDEESLVLRQCAVFRGGFDVAAADAVIVSGAHPVATILTSLTDRALLHERDTPLDRFSKRYDLPDGVRAYASEALFSSGSFEEACERHARFFLSLAESHEEHASEEEALAHLERLRYEEENFLAIYHRALYGDGLPADPTLTLRAALALDPLYGVRGPYTAHLAIFDAAIEAAEESPAVPERLLARALDARSIVLHAVGRGGEAEQDLHRTLAIWRREGDPVGEARALARLGSFALIEGRKEAAEAHLETALRMSVGNKHHGGQALALSWLGLLATHSGEPERGGSYYLRALVHATQSGDLQLQGLVLGLQAGAHATMRKYDEARGCYGRAIRAVQACGDRRNEARILCNFALLEQDLGERDAALKHFDASFAIFRLLGDRSNLPVVLGYRATLLHEMGKLSEVLPAYEHAIELLGALGNSRLVALFTACRASALARLGQNEEAERSCASALELAERLGDPLLRQAISLHRGVVQVLTEGRAPPADEDADDTGSTTASAPVSYVMGGPTLTALSSSDNARLALRLLKQALELRE